MEVSTGKLVFAFPVLKSCVVFIFGGWQFMSGYFFSEDRKKLNSCGLREKENRVLMAKFYL
jgi:hypothetical protein